jgi:hypothetical protein
MSADFGEGAREAAGEGETLEEEDAELEAFNEWRMYRDESLSISACRSCTLISFSLIS